MARSGGVEDPRSPFLLEALEPFQEAPAPAGLVQDVAAVSRRLSRAARRHLRRALVRHLVDRGVGESEALEAVESESPFLEAESEGLVETPEEGEASPFLSDEAFEGERDDEAPDDEAPDDEAMDGEAPDEEGVLESEHDAFAYESAPRLEPATFIDTQAAEPAFPATLRKRLFPILDRAAVEKAVAYNAAQHPRVSEIPLADLRRRLEAYVERVGLETALGANPEEAILTAQLAYQFQRKCFREGRFHTGKLDEPTLDALGFVRHRGAKLNRADRTNRAAAGVLRKALTRALTQPLGPDVTARTWFSFMLDAPFLGLTTRYGTGIHLELMRRLRAGQAHLWTLPAYRDLSPVELGDALLWDPADDPSPHATSWTQPRDADAKLGDRHRGARPGSAGASMHLPGLAIDLAYRASPWVGSLTFKEVTGRAATLVGGTVARTAGSRARAAKAVGELSDAHGLGRKALHTLAQGTRTTGEIYDALAQWNAWLERYLELAKSDAELRGVIAARQADGTDGVVRAGETAAQAADRWRTQIKQDFQTLRRGSFSADGEPRDPQKGFLSFRRDLVIALRDRSCLAWGAVDLGHGDKGSGDMMHFDCRVQGIGRAFAVAASKGNVPKVHPCLGRSAREAEAGPLEELELELKPVRAARLKGKLFRLESRQGGSTTAVFVPDAALKTDPVSLLVWIHGDPVCGGEGANALSYVQSDTLPIAKILADSGRPYVLVVPSMRWVRGQGFHKLAEPKRMGAFIEEVRGTLVDAGWPSRPAIGKLILAGHSHAFAVLDGLAHKAEDIEWVNDPLARLTGVWSFDTMYGQRSCASEKWTVWAAIQRKVSFRVLFLRGSATAPEAARLRNKVNAAGIQNLKVQELVRDDDPKTSDHCLMPARHLRALLDSKDSGV